MDDIHALPKRLRLAAWLTIAAAGLLPIVLYWLCLGRVPAIGPDEAKEVLSDPQGGVVLVDVRDAKRYAANHLEGAKNWPLAEINGQAGVPSQFRGKRLLLICDSGVLSGLAAQKLKEQGADVANVRGGMQAWTSSAEKPCATGFCRLRLASGEPGELPFRESPVGEQLAVVLTGFVVKPVYTVISLVLFLVLWRQTAPDLVALRRAMLAFFIGENFCAANYLIYNDGSYLFEYSHSFGMALCFGLSTFALLEGFDRRLIKLSDPEGKCAAVGLCRRCIKHADSPCGLRRAFLLIIPAMMLLAWMPLSADLTTVSYNTRIFGTFYNYSHPVVHQIYEIRYCPVAALALLGVALGLLAFKRDEPVLWSKVFFSAGMGALGFSFFRLAFVQFYRDNLVYFTVWEELTELLFVVSAAAMLWIFRQGLFLPRRPEDG